MSFLAGDFCTVRKFPVSKIFYQSQKYFISFKNFYESQRYFISLKKIFISLVRPSNGAYARHCAASVFRCLQKALVWSLWTTSVHKSISKAKVWLDNFAFLVSLIIFRRVFIKLCQLQFWSVILICTHPFLHQQVEVEMRFKVRAKIQVHARNTNFSMVFLTNFWKHLRARHHCAHPNSSFQRPGIVARALKTACALC